MDGHLAEDELLDLAAGRQALTTAPAVEAHLADCSTCRALLHALVTTPEPDRGPRDRAGTRLGAYRLDGLIGVGGMGEVYRAWDERLQRHVAVKVLSPKFAAEPGRLWSAEGRAAAAINHANVVTIYDTGLDDGIAYVVTELVAGESLRSVIDRGPIAPTTARELMRQLARGLAAAHARGVLHRDLKPENLLVTSDGTLKIVDFGLARLADDDGTAIEPGAVVGTAGYLAPEQARGEAGDARSDLFAFGAVAYELATGRRAFPGATAADRLLATLRDPPAPFTDPAAAIILRCLDQEPRKRFQSAEDLAWALDGVAPRPTAEPAAPTARRPTVSRRSFVLGAAATGVGGLWLGRRLAAPRGPTFVPDFHQFTFRQGRVASARFTPDGDSLLYTAWWDELPAAIYSARVGGGGTRRLDLPAAQLLAVSRRGQLAISLDHHYVDGFHQQGTLALAPLEGGPPRSLGLAVQDADFAADEELAIVRPVGGQFQLELPAGRVLLTGGWLSRPRVSPDGAHVACLVHDSPGDNRGDVVLVSRAGGATRTISADWSSIDGLAWAPDGRSLWISASRSGGNNAVRALALDGRELGPLPSAGRLRVDDVGPGGLMAATHISGRLRMMVRAPGAAAEVDLAVSDVAMVTAMAPDGRTLAFAEFGDVDTASGAYLRATTGEPAVRLGEGMPTDLADDDRGVLVLLTGAPPTAAALPVGGGPARALPLASLGRVRDLRWCVDGGVVVEGAEPGRPLRLWRLDRAGALSPITDEGVAGVHAVSADGRRLAVIVDGRLLIVEVTAPRPARPLPGVFADALVCGWDADDQILVRTQASNTEIRRVDPSTGQSTPVRTIEPPRVGQRGVYAVVLSRDASAYAYSYAQELSRLYTMTTPRHR